MININQFYFNVATLLLISFSCGASNASDFKLMDIEVFAKRGLKFFTSSTGRETNRSLYAIPNTKKYRGWQVTQLGEIQNGRSPIRVCRNGADCYTGWVAEKWTRPTNKPVKSFITEKAEPRKMTTPTMTDEDKHDPALEIPSCIGTVHTKIPGLALRTVKKSSNRLKKGKFLSCSLKSNVDLCITDANNNTGRNSWVEAILNKNNFDKLSVSCQRNLNNAARDGLIEKNSAGEYVVSLYTNTSYVDTRGASLESLSSKALTEATNTLCDDCTQQESVFDKIIEQVEGVNNVARLELENSSHPEGWPISADGYSYPIDPEKAYITSNVGLRKLRNPNTGKTYLDYHEGIDFGTNGEIINFHAMKSGRVKKVIMSCGSKSLESCGGGYGNQIQIEHSDGTTMWYSHLHANCWVRVKRGQEVQVGQKLGCVGYSGRGPTHLDVRLLKKNGDPYNRKKILANRPWNGKQTRIIVNVDFIPIAPKLQSLYTHFAKKKDYRTKRALIAALAERENYIRQLGIEL
ncbi:MAG: M23 family metallopeptidase [Bdellovibrionaceae bacterium]|nr:M23 family metallopeptidase [Pseudobdellovibrionaceae bacterium]